MPTVYRKNSKPQTPEKELLNEFTGAIKPIRVGMLYHLGLVIVALAMILLPLLYVSLIGLTIYGVFYHATHNIGILRVAFYITVLLYITPIVVGIILVLFMIKPLLAKQASYVKPISLNRRNEPLLFAFVNKICQIVDAPAPYRIDITCDVNASAGFQGGIGSIFNNNLILCIGLPLMAGLNLQQFAGVLAHEFGHFRQGAGRRLTYITRAINAWFVRVVYQRDIWDDRLAIWSRKEDIDFRIKIILYLAQFFVWINRNILWVFMMTGHSISAFMLRQMEFDADRYEARLAGSETFTSTTMSIRALALASRNVLQELGDSWQEKRLGDNIPALILAKAKSFSQNVLLQIKEDILKEKTGFGDTHPSDKDRIYSAQREQSAGIFNLKESATSLFSNFEYLAKMATRSYYHDILGVQLEQKNLVSTDELLGQQSQTQAGDKAMNRYFQGMLTGTRLVIPTAESIVAPTNPQQTLQQLRDMRQGMVESLKPAKDAYQQYHRGNDLIDDAVQASTLLTAKFMINAKQFNLPSANHEGIERLYDKASTIQKAASEKLDTFEEKINCRLISALQLMHHPKVAERIIAADNKLKQAKTLVAVLCKIGGIFPQILSLQKECIALATLLHNLDGNENNEDLSREMQKLLPPIQECLWGIQNNFAQTTYPFTHAHGEISIASYLMDSLPGKTDFNMIYDTVRNMLDKYYSLYYRIMGQLALTAEEVESAVGLKPLPDPTPEKI